MLHFTMNIENRWYNGEYLKPTELLTQTRATEKEAPRNCYKKPTRARTKKDS